MEHDVKPEWGEQHRREAGAAICEELRKACLVGNWVRAGGLTLSETNFAVATKDPRYLGIVLERALGLKRARAVVRRVRDFAEDRRVREEGYRAVLCFGELGEFRRDRDDAVDEAREADVDDDGKGRVVRVVRKRKVR